MSEQSELLEMYGRDPVMITYIRLGYIKTRLDAGKLHQFFSSRNIPEELTEKQIQVCLKLVPIRVKQKELHRKKYGRHILQSELRKMAITRDVVYSAGDAGMDLSPEEVERKVLAIEAELPPLPDITVQLPPLWTPDLPRELCESPMTPEHFQIGMEKFIEQAFKIKLI